MIVWTVYHLGFLYKGICGYLLTFSLFSISIPFHFSSFFFKLLNLRRKVYTVLEHLKLVQ